MPIKVIANVHPIMNLKVASKSFFMLGISYQILGTSPTCFTHRRVTLNLIMVSRVLTRIPVSIRAANQEHSY
jgi:hypothetical protein